MNNFPYPILTETGSSYRDDIYFSIDCIKQYVEDEEVKIEVEFKLNSSFLLKLIEQNKASLILHSSSSIINKIDLVNDINNKYIVSIPTSDIKSNDTLHLISYVISSEPIILTKNNEFNNIFDFDFEVSIKKGDRLAISNKEKLSFYTENNSFIRFKSSEEIDNGYKISLSDENYIAVLVPVDFIKSYKIISRKKEFFMLVDSNIIFEVIVYVLLQISQDYYECKDKAWCESLARMFDECGEDIEEFIELSTNEDKINIEYVYETAHKLTNNKIVDSLIKAGDSVRTNGDNE